MRDELVYVHLGLGEQTIPYLRGWELQRQIHGQRVNGETPDTCLLLQHEPVFTAGKRTSPLDRRWATQGRRWSRWTGAARSPGAVPASPSGTRVIRLGVPCGIRDAGVTSLSAEPGQPVGVQDMLGAVERHLAGVLGAVRWRRAVMSPVLV